jgi:hypothetical protein
MIYEVRKVPELFRNFSARLEELMDRYGLAPEEKQAFRDHDIKRLRDLGVHPYFLPQVTRLLHGSAKNDSKSEAAQAYKRSMIDSARGVGEN